MYVDVSSTLYYIILYYTCTCIDLYMYSTCMLDIVHVHVGVYYSNFF